MCFIVTIKKNNIPLSIKTTSSPEKKRENKSVAFTALVSEQEAFNSGVLGACGRESVFALKRHLTMPGGIFNCCTCRGCFWHLASKDQGSCEIAYNAQGHNLSTSKELPHHNTSSAAQRNFKEQKEESVFMLVRNSAWEGYMVTCIFCAMLFHL